MVQLIACAPSIDGVSRARSWATVYGSTVRPLPEQSVSSIIVFSMGKNRNFPRGITAVRVSAAPVKLPPRNQTLPCCPALASAVSNSG